MTQLAAAPVETTSETAERSDGRADRFMRRLLRVSTKFEAASDGAHRALRRSIVISAIRCTIMYLVVPIVIPLVTVANLVAAPLGILLSVAAGINGVISLRRFWTADSRSRWTYTIFIGVVFAVLIVGTVFDVRSLVEAWS